MFPKPGEVGLAVSVKADASVEWADPIVAKVLGAQGGDVRSQAGELTAVRRHLGWELTPVLVPADAVSLADLLRVSAEWITEGSDWTGPPEIRWTSGTNAAPARLVLRAATGAPGEVRVEPGVTGEGLRARLRESPGGGWARPGTTTWGMVRPVLMETLRPGERRELLIMPRN
jgi:hypothetical protein